MISRFILAVGLAILMVVTGTSSYVYLARHQSKLAVAPEKPTAATPRANAFTLPGTLYFAQGGAIYSLEAGRFHQLTPEQGWTQPSLFPNGTALLAVKQNAQYSDVYVLNTFGTVMRRITNNTTTSRFQSISDYHWSFYPRLSFDGGTVWMSYDQPKFGYDVVLSVWAMPVGGTIRQGKLWTNAADYTGGDAQPVPAPGGGIVYTKYSYGLDGTLSGQLWFTNRAYSAGRALTTPAEDCRDPAFSPSGTQVAMVCTYGKQLSELTIAPWSASTLGRRQTVISDQMVAQPVWAPDGSGLAYFAPGFADGPFQLWWLPSAAYTAPPPVPTPPATPGGPHNGPLPSPSAGPPPPSTARIEVTTNLGFDATSPMSWGA
ncbi:MAG TPA: hypothetical protein VGG31_03110 [Candidatus Dormibacteraeota bacterium]